MVFDAGQLERATRKPGAGAPSVAHTFGHSRTDGTAVSFGRAASTAAKRSGALGRRHDRLGTGRLGIPQAHRGMAFATHHPGSPCAGIGGGLPFGIDMLWGRYAEERHPGRPRWPPEWQVECPLSFRSGGRHRDPHGQLVLQLYVDGWRRGEHDDAVRSDRGEIAA